MIRIKKINNHVITPIPVDKIEADKIKGYDLIPKLYCTIFLCARKESGKTNCIFKILKECSTKKTILYLISSTVYNDQNYEKICEYFENRGNEIHKFTSIKDAKLKPIVEQLTKEAEERIEAKKNKKVEPKKKLKLFDDEEEEKPEKKPKKLGPEIIFVFDDLSTNLRDPDVSELIKKHRHFLTKVIVSSQYPNDMLPEARNNIDFWILFAGHSEEKLFTIFTNCDLKISFDLFKALYEDATKEKYNFLYVNKPKNEFRKNFNLEYDLSAM